MRILKQLYSSRGGKVALGATLGAVLLLSAGAAQAASLTASQINAITALLQSFSVDAATISNVQAVLSGQPASSTVSTAGAINVFMIGNLRQGDKGEKVKYLQAILASDPTILSSDYITGFFGPLTAAAIRKFQAKHGLSQVGIIGPQTRLAFEKFLRDNPLELEDEDGSGTASTTHNGQNRGKRLCAKVPPGHLIAPGWLRKHDTDRPVVPICQELPPGIERKLDRDGSTTTPRTDVTAPTISQVAAGSVGTTSATITWKTNEKATSKVYFSTSTPIDLATALSATVTGLTTSHSAILTSLTASTTYRYVVQSADASGNSATSSEATFTTN